MCISAQATPTDACATAVNEAFGFPVTGGYD
jgi:hypothetical protein